MLGLGLVVVTTWVVLAFLDFEHDFLSLSLCALWFYITGPRLGDTLGVACFAICGVLTPRRLFHARGLETEAFVENFALLLQTAQTPA